MATSFEGARHPCRPAGRQGWRNQAFKLGACSPWALTARETCGPLRTLPCRLRPALPGSSSAPAAKRRFWCAGSATVRGQQYCGCECSGQARRERRREAAQRYQGSPRGRQLHAERSRRWRARQQATAPLITEAVLGEDAGTVTHQGGLAAQVDGPASAAAVPAVAAPDRWRCSCCRQPLTPYVRLGFLRRPQGRDRPS